jgi:hypothetical protein
MGHCRRVEAAEDLVCLLLIVCACVFIEHRRHTF